ncbi:LysM peptidoglycan-binding domain-containing protein [Subtercola lobariae]|uniref:LysM domain-containing protein n=1 Tax=Subtercola lobariae TaxID=1588641 RepID=A0A917B2D0_9MICO|nr:LysM domain-containing protein [Subtercola lobariae]GGF18926.1 hypothetical protein GCM10011399_10660 [Subtercola lobariae]
MPEPVYILDVLHTSVDEAKTGAEGSVTTDANGALHYTITTGDSALAIADRFRVDTTDLHISRCNGFLDLQPGDVLDGRFTTYADVHAPYPVCY